MHNSVVLPSDDSRHGSTRLQVLNAAAQSSKTSALVFSFFRSSLTFNMSLFSSNRPNTDSIAYSAMEREPSLDDDGSRAETIVNNDVETGRSSDNNCARGIRDISPSLCIEQSNKPPATYMGPEITAWPTTPRKLRGFSVPLFVGDVFLILVPIAFLGLLLGFLFSRGDDLTFDQYWGFVHGVSTEKLCLALGTWLKAPWPLALRYIPLLLQRLGAVA